MKCPPSFQFYCLDLHIGLNIRLGRPSRNLYYEVSVVGEVYRTSRSGTFWLYWKTERLLHYIQHDGAIWQWGFKVSALLIPSITLPISWTHMSSTQWYKTELSSSRIPQLAEISLRCMKFPFFNHAETNDLCASSHATYKMPSNINGGSLGLKGYTQYCANYVEGSWYITPIATINHHCTYISYLVQ